MPTFSIIIPVKQGGHVAALDSIRNLSAEVDSYELLIAEGSAPSRQRNLAASAARGELLYFLDDDSLVNPENLQLCAEIMSDENVAVVGGPSVTPACDSPVQQLFGAALSSPFGSGAVRNRYRVSGQNRETTEKELILCNLAIRRSVFMELGGFDERLYPNEENELLDRIRSSGFKLVHNPAMYVQRSQRRSLKAFVSQMFAYGRGRAQQTLISGSFSLVSFVPLFFTLYLVVTLFSGGNLLLLAPLLLYAVLAALFASAAICSTGRPYMLALLLIYPLMHCVNGCGLLYGLLGGKPMPLRDDSIVIRRVKEFGQEFPGS